MCGLFGFIGESKNHEVTKQICTSLFIRTQSRGTDASGFYCVKTYPNNSIGYYKKPVQAIEFIGLPEYKKLWDHHLNLGIFHCRAASAGVGIPAFNENNHPFVSKDNKKALIHNGVIIKPEYEFLKSFYEVETECDSELLLRMFEQDENIFNKISKFITYAKNSHYAVAYAETDENHRTLHLFRNIHRPLVLVDLREDLGQLFFCSTTDIFCESIEKVNKKFRNYKIYEIPEDAYSQVVLDISGDISYNEFKIDSSNADPQKIELDYCQIKKTVSGWNNILNMSSTDDIKDIINSMLDKIQENCNSIKNNMDNLNASSTDKAKINAIFGVLRDMNKKSDAILKVLGE
jgi:glucosamine 6-phosphate synthetase-like amidotransferase/phosphosugar isomerase protein